MPNLKRLVVQEIALVRKTHTPVHPEATIDIVKAEPLPTSAGDPARAAWRENMAGAFGDALRSALRTGVPAAEIAKADDSLSSTDTETEETTSEGDAAKGTHPYDGQHTHSHSHGGDTHTHEHSHNDDGTHAGHEHNDSEKAALAKAQMPPMVTRTGLIVKGAQDRPVADHKVATGVLIGKAGGSGPSALRKAERRRGVYDDGIPKGWHSEWATDERTIAFVAKADMGDGRGDEIAQRAKEIVDGASEGPEQAADMHPMTPTNLTYLAVKAEEAEQSGYASSDYLIVGNESLPSTWHLRIRDHGVINPTLVQAAHLALTEGYRSDTFGGEESALASAALQAVAAGEKIVLPGVEGVATEETPPAETPASVDPSVPSTETGASTEPVGETTPTTETAPSADFPAAETAPDAGAEPDQATVGKAVQAQYRDFMGRVVYPVQKAIQKSMGLYGMPAPDGSYEAITEAVMDAVREAFGSYPICVATFSDHVLYCTYSWSDGDDDDYQYYQVPYTMSADEVTLGARETVAVEHSYQIVAKAKAGAALNTLARGHVDSMTREANLFIKQLQTSATPASATASAPSGVSGSSAPDVQAGAADADASTVEETNMADTKVTTPGEQTPVLPVAKGAEGGDPVLAALQGLTSKLDALGPRVELAISKAEAAQAAVAGIDVTKAASDAVEKARVDAAAAQDDKIAKARSNPTAPTLLGDRRPSRDAQGPDLTGMSFGEATRTLMGTKF